MDQRNHSGRRLFLYLSAAFALTLTLALPVHAQVKWKHGVMEAKGDAGIFWMALEKGYFKEHGLDVEFVQFRSDMAITRAVIAGALDSGEPSPGGALKAIERGADLRFIGATMPGLPMALYVRKDISRWDQLKGKTFGISTPGSMPDIVSRQMLMRKGVDPDSIKIVNAGGDASKIKALIAGKVDATIASTQHVADADKLGIRVMAYAADLVPEYPRFVVIAKEKTLKERPDAAINFLAGYIQGLNYAMKHRAETLALTGKMNDKPANEPTFAHLYDEVIAKHYVAANMEVPRAKIEWLQSQLLKSGGLSNAVDLDKYIDEHYQQAALKRANLP